MKSIFLKVKSVVFFYQLREAGVGIGQEYKQAMGTPGDSWVFFLKEANWKEKKGKGWGLREVMRKGREESGAEKAGDLGRNGSRRGRRKLCQPSKCTLTFQSVPVPGSLVRDLVLSLFS